MSHLLQRISEDSAICFGAPCIKGTRIHVAVILDMLDSGETIQSILQSYPQLIEDGVQACVAYSEIVSNKVPAEHKRILDERLEKIATGRIEFKSWSEVKGKYKRS